MGSCVRFIEMRFWCCWNFGGTSGDTVTLYSFSFIGPIAANEEVSLGESILLLRGANLENNMLIGRLKVLDFLLTISRVWRSVDSQCCASEGTYGTTPAARRGFSSLSSSSTRLVGPSDAGTVLWFSVGCFGAFVVEKGLETLGG